MVEAKMRAVVALIERGDLVLAVSRKGDPEALGLPGGKVDAGESPREALLRECAEELGPGATLGMEPIFISFDGDFEVSAFRGEVSLDWIPSPGEGEGMVSWVTRAQLEAGPFGDYNTRLFREKKV
jgi:8-oxo-dGTP diphosphatase